MAQRAVIFGCAGFEPGPRELEFFAETQPWGFILFARNISTPEQVYRLTSELRSSVGRDAPVLIDQEGGRVARMAAPWWREWLPALEECARLHDPALRARAMYLRYRLIATELRACGVDVNCAPVLDLVRAETHEVIRNRCYGAVPEEVADIGRAVAQGLLGGGVVPVMKHIPGQGRAPLDSHRELPVIGTGLAELLAVDFAPFRALADLPMAMTAHVVYSAIDPDAPVTLSKAAVGLIRRETRFDGLLLSDDLSMQALTGDFASRAARATGAGCDVILHCNGKLSEMQAVAAGSPLLSGTAAGRATQALSHRRISVADMAHVAAELAALQEGAVNA